MEKKLKRKHKKLEKNNEKQAEKKRPVRLYISNIYAAGGEYKSEVKMRQINEVETNL